MPHVSSLLPYKRLPQPTEAIVCSALSKMAFKLALIVAVFLAQGYAFKFRSNEECTNAGTAFPYEIDQTVTEIDDVRDTVSMTALDAYAGGKSIKVILACYGLQKGKYIRLGLRISKMVTKASFEMSVRFADKASKFALLVEPPLLKIAFTVVGVVDSVYTHIKNLQYLKAAEAIIEARRIIDENAREAAKHIVDFASEMPELSARADELSKEIHKEARETCDAIRQAFKTCVDQGGPLKPQVNEEESKQIESAEE